MGRKRRPLRARVSYAEDVAEAICARVAAGESLSALERQGGFPTRRAMTYWKKSAPGFAEELAEAQRRARLVRRVSDRAAEAARLAQPRQRDGGHVSHYTPALGEAICARIADGESVVGIARDPDMPCAGTIYRWVQRHPEFEEIYVQARQLQADYLFDEAREVAKAATTGGVWVARLQFDVIRWQTARLSPKKYCEKIVVAQVAAEAREPGSLTVMVQRFTDPPEGADAPGALKPGEARTLYTIPMAAARGGGRSDRGN